MIVEDTEAFHPKASPRVIEINIDCVVVHRDHPENVIRVDVHIVVMNLLSENSRSDRTGVQVQSNKRECALMPLTVGTNELALTKAHVSLVRQSHGGAGAGVCPGAAASDVRQPHEAVEISDLGWVIEHGQRKSRVKRIVMDEDSEGSKWRHTPRNRVGPAVIIAVCAGRLWRQDTSAKHRAGAC